MLETGLVQIVDLGPSVGIDNRMDLVEEITLGERRVISEEVNTD